MAIIVTKRAANDDRNEVSLVHPLPVSVSNPQAEAYLFDDTGATSTLPTRLTAIVAFPTVLAHSVLIQNDPASTVNVLVGNGLTQSVVLRPGEAEAIEPTAPGVVINLSSVFVKSASGTPSINVHALLAAP